MNLLKLVLSICALLLILLWCKVSMDQSEEEIALRASSKIEYADKLDVHYRGTGRIHFRLKGKEFKQKIYISRAECKALRSQQKIAVKVGATQIVFANNDYNDNIKLEQYSIVLIGLALTFVIVRYFIAPEIQKLNKKGADKYL